MEPSDMGEEGDPGAGFAYSYKPTLMGEALEFRLTPHALQWRISGRTGETPYEHMQRLRLSFRPTTLQTGRFMTEIWSSQGPKLVIASTSWRGLIDQERHDAAYTRFVSELVRRIGLANSQTTFEAGSVPVIYWAGLVVFVVACLGLAALMTKALASQAWTPALIVAGFLAIFLWQTGGYFRRNRPARFEPEAIPPEVLPRP